MNRRHILAVGGLVVLALLAGCSLGPTEIPDEELTQNETYDWESGANATFSLSRSSYTAVLDVSNQSTVTVFRRNGLGIESPVRPRALRFQFLNGTVVNATHANLSATVRSDSTLLKLPADNGTVGYRAGRSGKQFATPVFVEGSHQVVLPAGTRIGVPLLSQASPGGYSTTVGSDNRMTVRWEELTGGTVTVRYYLQRDLLLFSLLVVVVAVLGGGGLVYYLRQIRRLESRREDIGIDVDDQETDRDDPPPGMG